MFFCACAPHVTVPINKQHVLYTTNISKTTGDTIYIEPFVGVGNLVKGVSTKRDIFRELGKTKVHRSRQNGELYLPGYSVKTLYYPEYGLVFSLDCQYFCKKRISYILIDSTSIIKTREGIGIGSTFEDIVAVYGFESFFGKKGPVFSGSITVRDIESEKLMHFGSLDLRAHTGNFIVKYIFPAFN